MLLMFFKTEVFGTIGCTSDSILLYQKKSNKKKFLSESIIKNIFFYTSNNISLDNRKNLSSRVIDRIHGIPFLEEGILFHFKFSPYIEKFVYNSREYFIHSYEFFLNDGFNKSFSYLTESIILDDFGNGYSKLMSCGTIAVTCDLSEILFLGGFLYTDTIPDFYNLCKQDSNRMKMYIELKYINYIPDKVILQHDSEGRLLYATFHSSLRDAEFRVNFHQEIDELVLIRSNQAILSFERESLFLLFGIPKFQ